VFEDERLGRVDERFVLLDVVEPISDSHDHSSKEAVSMYIVVACYRMCVNIIDAMELNFSNVPV
jgi:hypothetical protein